MKRRILSILLLFLYLIPSIGVSGSVHYCGGEVAAIVIIPTDEHPCACGPSEPMEDGCCKDVNFSFKIKDNHKNADCKILVNDLSDYAFIQKIVPADYILAPLLKGTKQFRIKEKEPPNQRLFILYESYLI